MPATTIDLRPRDGLASSSRAQTIAAAFAAAIVGIFLVWSVGFAPIAALHNAAHDVRHSMAFPCH